MQMIFLKCVTAYFRHNHVVMDSDSEFLLSLFLWITGYFFVRFNGQLVSKYDLVMMEKLYCIPTKANQNLNP